MTAHELPPPFVHFCHCPFEKKRQFIRRNNVNGCISELQHFARSNNVVLPNEEELKGPIKDELSG